MRSRSGARCRNIAGRLKARMAGAWELAQDAAFLNPLIPNHDECLDELSTRVRAEVHKLEKSLAIPDPRRPCGTRPQLRMRRLLETDEALLLDEETKYQAANALASVQRWNEDGVNSLAAAPQEWCATAGESHHRNLFKTRHSIRSFDPGRIVDPAILRDIVALAQSAPSSCNRNPSRAHVFTEPAWVAEILHLQDGATGFEHSTPALIVITAQRAGYTGARERNQLWIDGALFAMTLVWVAHANGLSSCMLHWRYGQAKTRALRKLADIPRSECVVCLIALGYGSAGARLTPSRRPPLETVMTNHEPRRRN